MFTRILALLALIISTYVLVNLPPSSLYPVQMAIAQGVPRLSGPLEGLDPNIMRGYNQIETIYEDFERRLSDETSPTLATPNDFSRSGFTCTPQGTLAGPGPFLRVNHSASATGDLTKAEASSLFVLTPGGGTGATGADDGINCQHNYPDAVHFTSSDTSTTCSSTPCTVNVDLIMDHAHFNFLDVNFGIIPEGFGREYRWATWVLLGVNQGTGWDAKFATGLSVNDSDVMNDSTGAITVGASAGQWASDGGFLFVVNPAKELRVYINSVLGGLTVLGPVDLTSLVPGGLELGAVWSTEDTDGGGRSAFEGRFKAYYRKASSPTKVFNQWIQIGDEVVGNKFWSTNTQYKWTQEIVNGASTGAQARVTAYTDWVAGGITREVYAE